MKVKQNIALINKFVLYEEFHGMREEVILKSVKVLEADNRAQVFALDHGKFGVKFK